MTFRKLGIYRGGARSRAGGGAGNGSAGGGQGHGSGGAANFWNPADTNADIVLSNSNLTMTRINGSGTWRGSRSKRGSATGKYYVECVCTTAFSGGSSNILGLANSTAPLDLYMSVDGNSIGWAPDGGIWRNNAKISTIQTYGTINDVCSMAWDNDNGKFWFRTNGGNWNNDILANQNPATNTGGFTYSGLAGTLYIFGIITNETWACTLRPKSSQWAYSAPSGFIQS